MSKPENRTMTGAIEPLHIPLQRWYPTTDPHHLRRFGKSGEELGELMSVVARIQIQGIDAVDPSSGKVNRVRFEDELADVLAQLECNIEVFALDRARIDGRVATKIAYMAEWESHFADPALAAQQRAETPPERAEPKPAWPPAIKVKIDNVNGEQLPVVGWYDDTVYVALPGRAETPPEPTDEQIDAIADKTLFADPRRVDYDKARAFARAVLATPPERAETPQASPTPTYETDGSVEAALGFPLGPKDSTMPFPDDWQASPSVPEPLKEAARQIMLGIENDAYPREEINLEDVWAVCKAYLAALSAPQASPALSECSDNDSPWLICKTCAASGRCSRQFADKLVVALARTAGDLHKACEHVFAAQAKGAAQPPTDEQIDATISASALPLVSYGEDYWDVDGLIRKIDMRGMIRSVLDSVHPAQPSGKEKRAP